MNRLPDRRVGTICEADVLRAQNVEGIPSQLSDVPKAVTAKRDFYITTGVVTAEYAHVFNRVNRRIRNPLVSGTESGKGWVRLWEKIGFVTKDGRFVDPLNGGTR